MLDEDSVSDKGRERMVVDRAEVTIFSTEYGAF